MSETSKLPAGKGNPPQEDPQVFLGAMSLRSLGDSQITHSHAQTVSYPVQFTDINLPLFTYILFIIFTSFPHFIRHLSIIVTMLEGIRHPSFTRLSKTKYRIMDGHFCNSASEMGRFDRVLKVNSKK